MPRSRARSAFLALLLCSGCSVQSLSDDAIDGEDGSGDGVDGEDNDEDGAHGGGDIGDGFSFRDAVAEQGRLPAVPDDALVELEPQADEPTEDRCGAVSYWERTKSFDRMAVHDTHGPELFPGNVLAGDDVLEGRLAPLYGALAPVTYSLSIQNAERVSAVLETPSLDSYRTSWNALLAEAQGASSPAMVEFHLSAVSTEEELSTVLEGSVGLLDLFELGAELQFDSSDIQSRFVVSFEQTYYTVDAEPKDSPDDFFVRDAPSVDSPPVYIRSIRYGRRVLLAVASHSSEVETAEMLRVGLTDANRGLGFGASFSDSQRSAFSSLEIYARVTGGNATNALQQVGSVESLGALLISGAEFSASNPGAPIDFQLAHVLDNSLARMYEVSQYRKYSCVDLLVGLELIDAAGDSLGDPGEFFGPLVLYVTEDANEPCGVGRNLLLGNMGTDWTGDLLSEYAIQVPSGADRPVCLFGSLMEADVLSDDDYGLVDLVFTLPEPPMTDVEEQVELTDGTDILSLSATLSVAGASAVALD